MNLVKWAARGREAERNAGQPWPSMTLDQLPYWFGQFGYQGLGYGPAIIQTIQQNRETIAADFTGYINGAYKTNGIVFSVLLCRMMLFSEARFQWRALQNGRPGKLFGTKDLDLLEKPWPNATTGDLLTKALLDADLAGNFYCTRTKRQDRRAGDPWSKIGRLRPDWVTILKGSMDDPSLESSWDPSAELVGYIYTPGGPGAAKKPTFYLPHEVAHFAPVPDPLASYRGMSFLQPVLTEVLSDRAMVTHKQMFFENGATPNLVVSLDTGKMTREVFEKWIESFETEHASAINAYKTLYLGLGADVKVIGTNLRDLDYGNVMGQTELRIAAAGGVHPVILGIDKGLQASSLNNFGNARRLMADRTLRPLWRNFCASMETIVPAPPSAQLWYDDRDIPFLKEDAADQAEVQVTVATAMRMLVDAGFDPDSVVKAIENNDFSMLEHSGLYSVQLQPPGTKTDPQVMFPNGGLGAPSGPKAPAGGSGNGQGNGSGNGQGNGTPQPALPAKSASADRRATMLSGITDVQGLAKALIAARAGD